MSIETIGSVAWADPGFDYLSMSRASSLVGSNGWFDSTRGASAAIFRTKTRRPSKREGGRPQSGERSLPPVSHSEVASAGRPQTATTAASGDYSVTTASGRSSAWFGSRPSTRGSCDEGGTRLRARRRGGGRRRPPPPKPSPYPVRPDPWQPARAQRAFEKAAEAERHMQLWAEPAVQSWLVEKEAQRLLRVGTWAAEAVRLDGERPERMVAPMAPLNMWPRGQTASIALRTLGFDVAHRAEIACSRSAAELPSLSAARKATGEAWDAVCGDSPPQSFRPFQNPSHHSNADWMATERTPVHDNVDDTDEVDEVIKVVSALVDATVRAIQADDGDDSTSTD